MGFSTQLSDDGSELRMVVEGRFDFNIHAEFRSAYRDLPVNTKYVIDLRKTTYMDSSAMGMLLLLREHAGEKDADIRLENCNADLRKILSISNLDKMFVVE